MSLKDITITGSIGSIATQSYGQRTYISSTDEQSFPIEHITGSDAKAWPNFVQGENYTVNLVVNVTQSWSGSNVTPLGDVPYVHNTMEEFIDGEFSGSNYVVTDGNLNDAQCEQFLTVNTVFSNYSVFVYFWDVFSSYINSQTSPNPGQILLFLKDTGTSHAIQYVKIARVDQEGINNTLSLQELTNIIWTDSNPFVGSNGKINLIIRNITEYLDFYLYEVELFPISYFNLLNDVNTLDYSFSASSAITASSPINNLTYIDQWTVYNSSSGYWDNYANFSYNYLTPNVLVYYTASIDIYLPVGLGLQNVTFGLWENNYAGNVIFYTPVQTITSKLNPGDPTTTVILSGSYAFVGSQDVQYHLEIITDYNYPVSLSNTFWIMTQSVNPNAIFYTSSMVIEPYLLSNFENSDCDVFMNNAFQNDESGLYRRVLYDGESGSLVPSNLQQIISGTAEYAQVNDYLFNAKANTLPRYEGSRVEQQVLNKWTQGDVGPSLTPSVQSLKTSVAYSTTVLDQAPIKMNASKAIVKYYIDEAGNTITPNVDKTSIYTAQGNFSNNTGFYIKTSTPNIENLIINFPLQGTTTPSQYKPIIRGGSRLEPILYNQIRDYTNPLMTWSPSMSFTDNNALSTATINNYTATIKSNTSYAILHNSPPKGIDLPQIIQRGTNIINELNNINKYTVTSTTFLTEGLDLVFYAEIHLFNNSISYNANVWGSIMRTRGGITDRYFRGYNSNPVFLTWVYGGASRAIMRIQGSVPASDIQIGDEFNIGLYTDDGGSTDPDSFGNVFYESPSYFKITTNPLPSPPVSTSGLFQTASSIPNYIFTTSSQLIEYYDNPIVRQVDITGSLFPPVTLPFTLQVGDEFRFDGDETKTFIVRDFDTYGSGSGSLNLNSGSLYIGFTTPISGSNVNINHFVLRRYVDDAESIIFENYGDKRMTGSMTLSPEYTTPQLQNNINKYIEDLTQKGLI